jgi:hypothetical protein
LILFSNARLLLLTILSGTSFETILAITTVDGNLCLWFYSWWGIGTSADEQVITRTEISNDPVDAREVETIDRECVIATACIEQNIFRVHDLEREGVAIAAVDAIGSLTRNFNFQGVITLACSDVNDISLTSSTIDHIVTIHMGPCHVIITSTGVDRVVSQTSCYCVISITALDLIISLVTLDGVVSAPSLDVVIALASTDEVISLTTIENIVAFTTLDDVIPVLT